MSQYLTVSEPCSLINVREWSQVPVSESTAVHIVTVNLNDKCSLFSRLVVSGSSSCPLTQWCRSANHLILCHSLFLLPSIFPIIRDFSNESALRIRWPKYRSFSFNSSPSNEYPGLISFRIDWLDLLAVQGTLKSLLQHHSSKASILGCLAFFIVQLSHPYMTIGKIIASISPALWASVFPFLCQP